MRVQIQGGGAALLLDWHGSRVLKRIILFSRASEILSDCQWLFVDQHLIHVHMDHIHHEHREHVHSKCAAAVLHATINQLVRQSGFVGSCQLAACGIMLAKRRSTGAA